MSKPITTPSHLTQVFSVTVISFAAVTSLVAADPFPAPSNRGVDIGVGLGRGYETSGVVWHEGLQRIFTVSDVGQISSMTADGDDVRHWTVFGDDLEGITVADPQSNFVYAISESRKAIVEFDIVAGEVTRRFGISRYLTERGTAGPESITYVADPLDPEGGLFYVGQQADSGIFAFRLPIRSSVTRTDVEFQFSIAMTPQRSDLSGMHYDARHDVLYSIWDNPNLLRATRPDGMFLAEWTLPGAAQEGVTFVGNDLLIAQESSHRLMRYGSFPIWSPEPSGRLSLWVGATLLVSRGRRRKALVADRRRLS